MSHSTTRLRRPLTVSVVAAAGLSLVLAPLAHAAGGTERIAGEDRYETAVEVSNLAVGEDGSADAVVLARGNDYADALTGSALAIDKDAPLLLTYQNSLARATADELQRVLGDEGTVYLLGGTSAISNAVAERVTELGYEVARLAGDNRYETAIAVADEIDPATLLVGTGTDFPDALTAGGAAGHHGGAVLLTNGRSLPSAIADYISGFGGQVYAVGGPAVEALNDVGGVIDVEGEDRYGTAVAVAETFFDLGPGLQGFNLASGQDFPDALAGAASSGGNGHPVLLAQSDNLPNVTASYLTEITEGRLLLGFVLGGKNAISDDVMEATDEALNPTEDDDSEDGDDSDA